MQYESVKTSNVVDSQRLEVVQSLKELLERHLTLSIMLHGPGDDR